MHHYPCRFPLEKDFIKTRQTEHHSESFVVSDSLSADVQIKIESLSVYPTLPVTYLLVLSCPRNVEMIVYETPAINELYLFYNIAANEVRGKNNFLFSYRIENARWRLTRDQS